MSERNGVSKLREGAGRTPLRFVAGHSNVRLVSSKAISCNPPDLGLSGHNGQPVVSFR